MSRITITDAYNISAEKIDYSSSTNLTDEEKSAIESDARVARSSELNGILYPDPDNKDIDPLEAFTILCAYFSGQQFRVMEEKLTEFEEMKTDYERVLNTSKKAHVYLAEAKAAEDKGVDDPSVDSGFKDDIDWILAGTDQTFGDISDDSEIDLDEAEGCVDACDIKKDFLSTELQALSTEVDMAVKDQGEAEQMAANAIKKQMDLLSAIGKTAGG